MARRGPMREKLVDFKGLDLLHRVVDEAHLSVVEVVGDVDLVVVQVDFSGDDDFHTGLFKGLAGIVGDSGIGNQDIDVLTSADAAETPALDLR